jgi:hypothetical protein
MPEWWTYSFRDFLLFSPRVYWRMIERHNEAVWPLHIPALLLGVTIAVLVVRPRPWSGLVVSTILALVWIWVAWSFLWNRYSTINWAAVYVFPWFLVEALLLLWLGGLRGHLHIAANRTVPSTIGLGVFLYSLVLYPDCRNSVGAADTGSGGIRHCSGSYCNCNTRDLVACFRQWRSSAARHPFGLVHCELGDTSLLRLTSKLCTPHCAWLSRRLAAFASNAKDHIVFA